MCRVEASEAFLVLFGMFIALVLVQLIFKQLDIMVEKKLVEIVCVVHICNPSTWKTEAGEL